MKNLIISIVAVSLSTSCATTSPITYVAPHGVTVEGRDARYPEPNTKNVATMPVGFSLPYSSRTIDLVCADGTRVQKSLVNDSLNPQNADAAIGLAVMAALSGTIWNFDISDTSKTLFGTFALVSSAFAAYDLMTGWQPARGVLVETDAALCAAKTAAADKDSDGDGLLDNVDRCPSEPETVNNVNDDDGCPDEGASLVAIKAGKIEISQKVFFETEKAVIQEQSFAVLNQVSSVLKNHPEIKQIRVEGHTDSVGDAAANMVLSQARADSVKAYLVSKGITATRLEARGFGVTRPVADNSTSEGRDQNRRVEFVIVATP
jgi:outer membrane protein OmpA-like peptidoglycan-associated protein